VRELDAAWDKVLAKADDMSRLEAFPLWTAGDAWVSASIDHGDRGVLPHDGSWMAGDLPSILWFASDRDPGAARSVALRESAMLWSRRLANRTRIASFASVAHMFLRGALIPLQEHGAEQLRPMMLEAGETVSRRFQRIGYMKSFGPAEDPEYPLTTIDDVINLCVPLWYAGQSGDEKLATATVQAATLIGERLVRPDGSAIQALLFDKNGTPSGVDTYQGYSVDGCWSRGLAWGIYGYAVIYGLSHDRFHLELAQSMADYWMDKVQDDPSPLWDFDLPAGAEPIRDSFAASLAYAGLLQLAGWSTAERAETLVAYTTEMMERLSRQYVIDHDGLGILSAAALDVPHDHGVGSKAAVIVGDSYYTEALWRLAKGNTAHPLLASEDGAPAEGLAVADRAN
jgi:unsaturated chondroitin disaccharide hydrolase